MTTELSVLVGTAAVLGFTHTILGPDHYLPFVMMSWARKWSAARTALITFVCGLGHIASSVILGLIGVALGLAVDRLEVVESSRGNVAAWLLIALGLAYLVWGIRAAIRNRPHSHAHFHGPESDHLYAADGTDEDHSHRHDHSGEHVHVHDDPSRVSIAPWALFVVFVFGPCEVLIPMLMYPAATGGLFGVIIVTSVFAAATIATMLAAVMIARAGVNFLPIRGLQRYSHALAGAAIFLCGLAIQFLGI